MEEELTLDLKDLFLTLRKRWYIIVAITLVATIVSGVISFFVIKPTYESRTSIFIGKDLSQENSEYTSNDIAMYQKLMKTYATIAKTEDVVAEAIEIGAFEELTVKDFLEVITVTPQADTQILDIKVKNGDPEIAQEMVQALSQAFFEKASEIYPNGNINILDTPKVPENPVSPNKKLNIAIAFLLGGMVSVGIVFLMEYMDSTIKREEELSRLLEIPVIGLIPDHELE